MPEYILVDEAGERHVLLLSISQFSRRMRNGVLRDKGKKLRIDYSAYGTGRHRLSGTVATNPGNYPMSCESLAVNPEDIKERMAEDARLGVGGTEYSRGGSPLMRDKRHYKKYRRAYGMHFRNSIES